MHLGRGNKNKNSTSQGLCKQSNECRMKGRPAGTTLTNSGQHNVPRNAREWSFRCIWKCVHIEAVISQLSKGWTSELFDEESDTGVCAWRETLDYGHNENGSFHWGCLALRAPQGHRWVLPEGGSAAGEAKNHTLHPFDVLLLPKSWSKTTKIMWKPWKAWMKVNLHRALISHLITFSNKLNRTVFSNDDMQTPEKHRSQKQSRSQMPAQFASRAQRHYCHWSVTIRGTYSSSTSNSVTIKLILLYRFMKEDWRNNSCPVYQS